MDPLAILNVFLLTLQLFGVVDREIAKSKYDPPPAVTPAEVPVETPDKTE